MNGRQPKRCPSAEIARRRQRMSALRALLEQGVIREAEAILQHWQCCLVLTDHSGIIIERWGDGRLLSSDQALWLEPGANWSERCCGCNAIGNCLSSGEAKAVVGHEHGCTSLHYLASFAVPLRTPRGNIDACLALICDAYRDRSQRYSGILQVLSMQIENRRLINHYHPDHYRLTFNSNRDNLDGPRSGLLILDRQGRLEATNTRAQWLLSLDAERDHGRPLESLCNGLWRDIITRQDALISLRFSGRYQCCCRLDAPTSIAPTAIPPSPLQQLDLGDPRMHQTIVLASRLMDSGISMLIHGETGTGKEVFVKALHDSSARAQSPLVAINCAAMPAELIEAELFGYVRGAFTGADPRGNIGRLREADGGRLFLDEIGDMPLRVQARLLRVLQERCVTPLGDGTPYPIDVEVIAATHRSMAEEVAAGRFRADLYYRLCCVELLLPPLRERSDIPQLIGVVLANLESTHGANQPLEYPTTAHKPSPQLLRWLLEQSWPGNIRELENVLRVILAMADGPTLELDHLPAHLLGSPSIAPIIPPASTSLAARLAEHRGNLSALARELGISRTTLYKRLREEPNEAALALFS